MKFISIQDLYLLCVIMLIKALSLSSSAKLKDYVANGLACLAYHVSRKKRRLSEKSISETLPGEITESQKQEIVKGNFYGFWRDTLSLSLSDDEKAALKRVELCGVEHLQKALEKGEGVIMWESGSFGGRNLAKQILHENGFSIYQLHAEHYTGGFRSGRNQSGNRRSPTWVRSHIIKPFFEKCEMRFIEEIVYLSHTDSLAFTRRLQSLLKQNAVICVTGDVGLGQRLIPLEFLGRTKFFSTGMVSLAKISGASILPMFCLREKDGKTRLIIEPAIQTGAIADRDRDLERSVAEYARLLESYIRTHPEKYRNWALRTSLPRIPRATLRHRLTGIIKKAL